MTDLNYDYAKRVAIEYLHQQNCEYELVLLEDETLAEEFGWVFFYNTKKFQETGDFRDMVGGNAPIIIDKDTGELTEAGTAFDIDYYIEEYRRSKNSK